MFLHVGGSGVQPQMCIRSSNKNLQILPPISTALRTVLDVWTNVRDPLVLLLAQNGICISTWLPANLDIYEASQPALCLCLKPYMTAELP